MRRPRISEFFAKFHILPVDHTHTSSRLAHHHILILPSAVLSSTTPRTLTAMPTPQQWVVARLENNRTAVALRFLELSGYAHYAPRARTFTSNRREIHPLLFAPYIFVEMIDGQWGPIKRTHGIDSIVLRGDSPAIVPPQIISALRKRENKNGLVDLAPRMRKGIRVTINTGPFAQYEGVLASDPSFRVKVLFDSILGAPREISFPHAAVSAL